MLVIKNLKNRIIYILLFLFALNVFNQSSLLLAIAGIFVIIMDRGKLYIDSKDIVFYELAIFAMTFFLFSSQNGLGAGISAIGCPMAYYIGLRIQKKSSNISYAEEKVKRIVLLLVAGMTSHALVNFIYEFIRFGGINSGGIHYDFFSLGAPTSATGAATYLTLLAGIIFYIIMESDSVKKWFVGVLIIIMVFAYNMILGGRTFFALVGVSFLLSFLVFIFGQKNDTRKIKALGKFLLIILVLFVAGVFVYIRYQDVITKMFQSTYLFHRISYASNVQSQDILSFFKSSDRGSIRGEYISLMFQYPWGGRKIFNEVGLYAHELWLDIFDAAGIIPFVLMWIVTMQITFCNLKYIFNKKVPLGNRVLLIGLTTSVTIQFFFEPALTGSRTLLFSYFLICGLIKSQLLKYKGVSV